MADPVFVLNSRVIVNGTLPDLSKEIQKVTVYKGLNSPEAQAQAPHLQNISPSGVIDITAPTRLASKSLAQVARRLGLRGPVHFALNGHPLDQPAVAKLRIASAAIDQIHILRPTAERPGTRVDIWLAAPAKRDYSKYPPGTIFIR